MTRPELKPGATGAIDGREYPITGAPNNVAKVSAKRINDATTESVGKPADGNVIENVTVTVSPDGKTLTRITKIQGPDGEFTMKASTRSELGILLARQRS
jgi:hypothetical protein